MSPAAPERRERVLAAVRTLQRRSGLPAGEPEVLSPGGANVVVGLPGLPLVVRCPVRTDLLPGQRVQDPWRLREEVALAGWLAAAGAPVVPPAAVAPDGDPLGAGPHVVDGLALTVWRRGRDPRPGEVAPEVLGTALRDLHEACADYPGGSRLVPLAPAGADLAAVLDRLAAGPLEPGAPGTPPALVARLREAWRTVNTVIGAQAGPVTALHGDPHAGNLLILDGRAVWNDFEDCCRGPAAWDLAVLLSAPGVDGPAAVRAYGADPQDPAVARLAQGRELQRAVWRTVRARTPEDVADVHTLLDTLLDTLPDPPVGQAAQSGRSTARMPTAGRGS